MLVHDSVFTCLCCGSILKLENAIVWYIHILQGFVSSVAYANIISLVEFSVKGEPFPDLWISRVTAVAPVVVLPICQCVDMIMHVVVWWISYHHILVKVSNGQGVFISSGLYVNSMRWELSVEKRFQTVKATLLLHWQMCVQAYDQHLNMILGEVEEVVTSVEIDDETYEEIVRVRHPLFLYHVQDICSVSVFLFQQQLTYLCRLELLLSSLFMLSLANLVRFEHFL